MSVGAGLTALSHLGFAFVADGFWTALILRAAAGIGWAGAYMPGLKAIADTLEGDAQSRAVSMHAAGVGVAGASSYAVSGLLGELFGPSGGVPVRRRLRQRRIARSRCAVMPRQAARSMRRASSPRALLDFRPVFRNRARDGMDRRLHGPHLGDGRAARLGRHLPHRRRRAGRRAVMAAVADRAASTIAGFVGIAVSITGNETAQRYGRMRVVTRR